MKRRRRRGPSPFVWVLLGIVVLGVVAIAFSRGGSDGDEEEGLVTAAVEVRGDPLGLPGEGVDPERGKEAPELRGIDFSGEAITITPGDRPTAVVFLAHWCPHCQTEVDALEEWLAAGNEFPEGVDVFAVSTLVDQTRGNYPPGPWLADLPVRTLVDDETSSAAEAYGLQGTPFWVFLDDRGRVVERVGGVIEPEELAERLVSLTR